MEQAFPRVIDEVWDPFLDPLEVMHFIGILVLFLKTIFKVFKSILLR